MGMWLVFAQALQITACSMLNFANVISNIELAGESKEYSL